MCTKALSRSSQSGVIANGPHEKGRTSKPAPIKRLRILIASSAAPGVSECRQSERKRPGRSELLGVGKHGIGLGQHGAAPGVGRGSVGLVGAVGEALGDAVDPMRLRRAKHLGVGRCQQLQVPVCSSDGGDHRVGIDAVDGTARL